MFLNEHCKNVMYDNTHPAY